MITRNNCSIYSTSHAKPLIGPPVAWHMPSSQESDSSKALVGLIKVIDKKS